MRARCGFFDYTEERLLAFLDRYQLTRDMGSQWEYSNLGVGLLGYLLQIFPEGPREFYWKALEAQIRFTVHAEGVVTGAALSQGRAALTGTRIKPSGR